MAKQSAFAGGHTIRKLDAIEKYLQAYRLVLSKTSFETVFFDAFAGTGELPRNEFGGNLLKGVIDKDEILEGSAQRALRISPPFSRYVFVEKMRGKAQELQNRTSELSGVGARNVEVIEGDANEELFRFCSSTNWRNARAVVFLDPFGNQVKWETIEAVARCPIDLWYLFPSFLGIGRQINRDGRIDEQKAKSIDGVYGSSDWREEFVHHEQVADLFGQTEVAIRQADADTATRFMIRRMLKVFKGGVLDNWLPLGKNDAQWYSLIFAWGNPSQQAGKIASRIAKSVMQRS